MSEFDKEAERERLREKFAEDEAERAATRHMGELLLQGVKMTDRHCPECGTPLFRDGERTFCPECDRQVVEEAEGGDAPEPAGEPASGAASAVEPRGDPRAHLERALVRSAAAAAETDDPREARDHLRAAQAAIEALRALDAA